MRRRATLMAIGLVFALLGVAAMRLSVSPVAAQEAAGVTPRFEALPIVIDPQGAALAAWQFQLRARNGAMKIVGVENGEHPAFAAAPWFDRDAVERGDAERVIVAHLSKRPADRLPQGPTRVATVHVMIERDAGIEFDLTLIAAGNPAGRRIDANIQIATPEAEGNPQ